MRSASVLLGTVFQLVEFLVGAGDDVRYRLLQHARAIQVVCGAELRRSRTHAKKLADNFRALSVGLGSSSRSSCLASEEGAARSLARSACSP